MNRAHLPGAERTALRLFVYLLGLVILAFSITLNTKTTLGVSPIISVSYCVSQIWGWNFSNITFLWYCALVLVEMALHCIRHASGLRQNLMADALQLVVCLLFTRFLNLFASVIPVFETEYPDTFAGSLPGRFLLLLLAVVLIGVGVDMSLSMRIVPNPGDGIVQGISDFAGIGTGTAKNLVDLCCVLLTCAVSLFFSHRVIGIGVGTLTAVLGVGRVVAGFERLCGRWLRLLVPETEPLHRAG